MTRAPRSLLLVAFVLLLGALPPAARAATAPCLPGGPTCTVWDGRVTFIADGDTLDVDVAGDGTHRPVRVRLTGVQAMEQSAYSRDPRKRRGECHALAATARVERLVRRANGRVRLLAQDPTSHSRHRARRSVAIRTRSGWRDVGRILMRDGLALWLPNKAEWAWNASYRSASMGAARKEAGLFDTDACGPGPFGRLQVTVNWDAPGNDGRNVNGEWIRITNRDLLAAVPIGGWWVRDSYLRRYRFPDFATVPAGGSLRVHVGRGSDTPLRYFWGLTRPAFENAVPDRRSLGDGAYLFDPQGDLRAWEIYP